MLQCGYSAEISLRRKESRDGVKESLISEGRPMSHSKCKMYLWYLNLFIMSYLKIRKLKPTQTQEEKYTEETK